MRPNNSFKPSPLRGSSKKPVLLGRAGLIQALGSIGRIMAAQIEDFYPLLREAIAEVRAAGLDSLADSLESRCFSAYTTSSELLGETGQAIAEFLTTTNAKVPSSATTKLKECLRQVQLVWPAIRT